MVHQNMFLSPHPLLLSPVSAAVCDCFELKKKNYKIAKVLTSPLLSDSGKESGAY